MILTHVGILILLPGRLIDSQIVSSLLYLAWARMLCEGLHSICCPLSHCLSSSLPPLSLFSHHNLLHTSSLLLCVAHSQSSRSVISRFSRLISSSFSPPVFLSASLAPFPLPSLHEAVHEDECGRDANMASEMYLQRVYELPSLSLKGHI